MKRGMDEKESAPERDRLDFPEAPQSGFAAFASAVGARNLMIVIVTMPLVFVVVVVAILAVFGDPDDASEMAESDVVRSRPALAQETSAVAGQRTVLPIPAAAEGAAAAIALPAGAEIGAMALDGDRLALRVNTDEGAMIVIYDLAEDAVVKTVPLTEEGVRE